MRKLISIGLGVIIGVVLIYGYQNYDKISAYFTLKNKIEIEDGVVIYIPTGSDQDKVADILLDKGIIKKKKKFLKLADTKSYYEDRIVPGKYTIGGKWTYDQLINHLRFGNGVEDVTVTFNMVRTWEDLAGKVATFIEPDSAEMLKVFKSKKTIKKYKFKEEVFITMFLPDSYRFKWDVTPEEFVERMAKEYKNYWNESRIAKRRKIKLSESEVTILASIVQSEQSKREDEWPIIAGLYINRLNKGMRLESDPTLKFALKRFKIRRVLNKDKKVESPYNTYKYKGLPPGPILLPSKKCMDAVLDYKEHEYIFMCAKPGYEGYHNFAKTYRQHQRNAKAYQRWLNSEGIRR